MDLGHLSEFAHPSITFVPEGHPRLMHKLTQTITLLGIASALTAFIAADASATLFFSSGPPNGFASEPPNFANCGQCHSGTDINGGSGSFSISGLPAEYTPGGGPVTLTLTLDDPGQTRWGFELTALDESGMGVGTFTITDTMNTQLSASAGREYIKQTSTGSYAGMSGPVSWSVDWTPPAAAGAGTVNFFATGNAADFNFSTSGDRIYSTATSSAESGAVHPDLTLTLQPHDTLVTGGDVLTVPGRVRNHTGALQNVAVVSRAVLPNGSFFPASGFLLPPIALSIPASGLDTAVMVHNIAPTTPAITVTYQGIVGMAPSTVIDIDEFSLTVF